MENFTEFKKAHYRTNTCVSMEGGVVFFSPDSQKQVVGAEKMSYDEYLDVQLASLGKMRRDFQSLYFNYALEFKGQIEKINRDHICFKRIYLCGMFPDGGTFEGHEDHVWMSRKGFEGCQEGDSLQFFAEVYRYVKTGSGKTIDYGLRDPEDIRQIPAYELPTDEELVMQSINEIICETCYLSEQCSRFLCLRPKHELRQLRKQMKKIILDGEQK